LLAKHGPRGGAVEYLRLLKLASEVSEAPVEVMLADFLSPPYPAWSVEELRRILQPTLRPTIEMAELQPEWSSYDRLLSPNPEVSCAG
jgi:hypothetical protein